VFAIKMHQLLINLFIYFVDEALLESGNNLEKGTCIWPDI